ncbi:hypothetical protein ACIHFE_07070 [Streptomyces sp. NPDC052396]|uniref:hypothetical protein n=1 Tax=Streptomyces sp. NPDC052396 TaxID=3365689 RepID=UPI0037D40D57
MASRASSDPSAPAELPGLGTSWHRRGLGYWVRRVAGPAGKLLVYLAVGGFAFGVYRLAVASLPSWARTACLVLLSAACLTGLALGWRSARKVLRERLLDPPTPEQTWEEHRSGRRRGVSAALSGRFAALLALPLLPALAAYGVGMVCANAFVRELPAEAGARRALGQRS